jgi:hypothetical protein
VSGHDDFQRLRARLDAELVRDPLRRARYEHRRAAYELIVALAELRESLDRAQVHLQDHLLLPHDELPRLVARYERFAATLTRYAETA